jgi:predicted DNA-binding transcriptional regulator AlpA
VGNLQNTEKLVVRVVASVLRELGHHVEAAPAAPAPEYLSDIDVRRTLIRVSRSRYFELAKTSDFPPATRIGRINFRKVSDVRDWLAARQVS